jgi:hypothetical protein
VPRGSSVGFHRPAQNPQQRRNNAEDQQTQPMSHTGYQNSPNEPKNGKYGQNNPNNSARRNREAEGEKTNFAERTEKWES